VNENVWTVDKEVQTAHKNVQTVNKEVQTKEKNTFCCMYKCSSYIIQGLPKI